MADGDLFWKHAFGLRGHLKLITCLWHISKTHEGVSVAHLQTHTIEARLWPFAPFYSLFSLYFIIIIWAILITYGYSTINCISRISKYKSGWLYLKTSKLGQYIIFYFFIFTNTTGGALADHVSKNHWRVCKHRAVLSGRISETRNIIWITTITLVTITFKYFF